MKLQNAKKPFCTCDKFVQKCRKMLYVYLHLKGTLVDCDLNPTPDLSSNSNTNLGVSPNHRETDVWQIVESPSASVPTKPIYVRDQQLLDHKQIIYFAYEFIS